MPTACPHCGLKFSDPSLVPSSCPNCGERLAPDHAVAGAGGNLITDYFRQVWRILTQPSAFFRSMPVRGGVSGPLAFALITHWLGSAASFLWRLLIGGALGGYIEHVMHMAGDVADVDSPGRNAQLMEMTERMKHWIWGAGSVIADPFLTLFRIFFISFLVYLGARIFVTPGKNGAPREITFESALRIICYGMTPAILSVLPIFGGPISSIYVMVVTVIGAREVYRIDSGRAVLVALFPQLLLFGIFLSVFFAIAVAFIKFFAMAF
jgi:hypothetical protein